MAEDRGDFDDFPFFFNKVSDFVETLGSGERDLAAFKRTFFMAVFFFMQLELLLHGADAKSRESWMIYNRGQSHPSRDDPIGARSAFLGKRLNSGELGAKETKVLHEYNTVNSCYFATYLLFNYIQESMEWLANCTFLSDSCAVRH